MTSNYFWCSALLDVSKKPKINLSGQTCEETEIINYGYTDQRGTHREGKISIHLQTPDVCFQIPDAAKEKRPKSGYTEVSHRDVYT